MARLAFNAEGVDTTSQFDAIPAGDYEAIVTASQEKTTKDGQGSYLELTLEIQSGQFQGRRLWDRLNLQNRNPKAVEIAQKQLAQLCHATGIMQVNDSEQLHNRPVIVKVSAKHDDFAGEIRNEVKGYKARAANSPQSGFQAPRAPAPTAPAAAKGGALPWQKAA